MQLSDLLQSTPPAIALRARVSHRLLPPLPLMFRQARSAAGVMPARSWLVHSPYLRKEQQP